MEIELNRRNFLIVLGAATSIAAEVRLPPRIGRLSATDAPFFYFAETCPEPTNRPRTTAIAYLPLLSS